MKRSFQPSIAAVVLTVAMLQAVVPASAVIIIHTGSGTYNYPGLTTGPDDDVKAYDTTRVNVLTSGSIGDDLKAWDNSKGTVSGGTIGVNLWTCDNSTVNVSGGTIGDDLYAYHGSTLTIIGSDFNFDSGDYMDGSLLDNQLLTGELADGTAINNTLYISSSSTVTLVAIPEPSCFAVFGIGSCGLVLVRRRRTATQRSAA